ncbi:hypothetical protein [Laspinema olomoucense]|uniref:hypothetical protein n=1 Tax=Laspinema olomoucense TaxID=3231600 RepID=UPI0021BB4486|nr:hypothetical protein [Laspinema sp. D3a]MCT7987566.1 hypothetical protein [Laspinema sp. D3a]
MLTLEIVIQKIQQFSPDQLAKIVEYIEFIEFQTNKVVSPSIDIKPQNKSFVESAQEFVGCLDSDLEDLSLNPQYLEGFGE